MPLAAVRLQSKGDKKGELFLMEFIKDLDYEKVIGFLNREIDRNLEKKKDFNKRGNQEYPYISTE